MNYLKRLILISLFLSSVFWARNFDLSIDDSLRSIHPRMRARWLNVRGIEDPYYSKPLLPDSQNVRCVGRWSYGPSYEITGETIGNNTYLFLSRGSGVSVLKFVSSDSIELLSDINASGLVMQAVVKDTLLYLGCYDFGIDIYNIANLQNPERINWIITTQNDFFIKDTLLYLIGTDTFKIFNISNPLSPYLLGSVADSGYSIYVSGNYAYLGDRWGLYILDVSNSQHPTRINTLSGGAQVGAIWVEDTFCYYTITYPDSKFMIANVSDPYNPSEVGSLNGVSGNDIYKLDYFVYMPGLDIIDVSIPSFPASISHLDLPGWDNGVWVNNPFGKGFVADDWEGLQIVDISDPTNPSADTSLLKAHDSYDIVVDTNYAYVANNYCGLKIIDISYPRFPLEVGAYDTIRQIPRLETATAKDSFAFIPQWWAIEFRSVDVSDPSRPRLAGINSQGFIQTAGDMVLKDSFVYVAKNYRLEIYNVALPRQPRLVGSCNLPDDAYGMCLNDTFAYIANQYAGLKIINITQPNNPYVAGTFSLSGWTNGVFVKDTIAYVASLDIGLRIVNVKNPQSPFEISSFPSGQTYDVFVKDSFAYVGCITLKVINVANLANPVEVGHYTTPDYVRRVYADSNYIYCACFSAGISIFENLLTGIKEEKNSQILPTFSVSPNPVFDRVIIRLNNQQGGRYEVSVYNVSGKLVVNRDVRLNKSSKEELINLSKLSDGVYFITIREGTQKYISKIVKVR